MKTAAKLGRAVLVCLGLCGLGIASDLEAQTSTGTLRGFVTSETGAPLVGANVVATNPATNLQRGTITGQNGFYNISGLPPGTYELRVSSLSYQPQTETLRLLVGQTLGVNFTMTTQAIAIEGIEARVDRVVEMSSPEVATNITTEQIENVPIPDRNFMTLAMLAPGVRADGNSISSGAQSQHQINVFIDGVSFKNDILQGGAVGQDASRGNPFPQDAVQEFRVITQQYKAEYQKATSAIVTATTKSGTNQWQGSAFLFGQNKNLINQDFMTIQRCEANPAQCIDQPRQDKWQGGASLGGPIIRDRLFLFGTYEGNHQNRNNTTTIQNPDRLPPELLNDFQRLVGTRTAPVRSNLYFGKLTYVPTVGSPHRVELSASIRDEYEIRNFGGIQAYETAEHFNNDVNTFVLKHQYARSALLNEAGVSFQKFQWLPIPLTRDTLNYLYEGVAEFGGRCCLQDFIQERLSLRNDLTYSLPAMLGDHVVKVGANLDFLNYDIVQSNFITPRFIFRQANNYAFPTEAQAGFGTPGVFVDNTQLGLYAQDDWTITSRLTLNLGVRWDYESNEMNNDFVTPDTTRQAILAYVATLPCGQPATDAATRARQLLCDTDRFLTDGTQRPSFKGAFQPRLGFSFDVFDNQRTVLFGGFGVYYDRNRYGNFLQEASRGRYAVYTFRFSADGAPVGGNPTVQWDPRYLSREGLLEILHTAPLPPRGELHLTANDTRPPRTNQFTFGVRQALRDYVFTANYTGVRGYNAYTMLRANRRPDGTCCEAAPGNYWSNLFVSTSEGRNWYDAMYLKAEKRYTDRSRWGAQIAYTLGKAEQNTNPGDRFGTLNVLTENELVRYPSANDERHHITANWIVGLPFDFRFSGIIDLGSGTPRNASIGFGPGTHPCTHGNQDCLAGNDFPEGRTQNWWRPPGQTFIIPDAWVSRNVDLRVEKRFTTFPGQQVGLVAEVFNVFDYANFTGWNMNYGQFQADGSVALNQDFGTPTGVVTDLRRFGAPRRFQLGMRYTF